MHVGEGERERLQEVKNKRWTQIWGKATQTLLVATQLEYDSMVQHSPFKYLREIDTVFLTE